MQNKLDILNIQTCADMAKVDMTKLEPTRLPQSIYDAIVSSAERYGDKTAIQYILDGDCLSPKQIPFGKKLTHQLVKLTKGKSFAAPYREISYRQLAQSVTQMANALQQFGITRQDVTSIILPNFPEMYVSLWGAESAGIANPINPMLDAKLIKEIMISANSKVLIALGPVPGSDIWQKILQIKEHVPSLTTVISLFGDDMPASAGNKVPVYSFAKLLALQNKLSLSCEAASQQDICSYFHTGGTTGVPKLAKHLHLNELSNAAQVNLISSFGAEDTMLVGLPIFHVNAAIATGLSSIMNGASILMAGPSGFRGKNVINNLFSILDNFKVTAMTAVPTVYAGLLESISLNAPISKPASMKLAMVGAAPLSPDLQAKFSQKTGIPLVEGYGSTEGTAVITLMPVNSLAQQASVGLTIPGVTLRIAEVDAKGEMIRLCNAGETGEILIAGNSVFPGYVDDSHNQKLWVTTTSGETLLRTGDLGTQDQKGYLSLRGRQKELIIRGGHNIDPKMIEDIASSHPQVLLAAAVPRPDSYAGELPVLYVTLRPDNPPSTAELMAYMQAHVPERAAIPKQIHVIAQMPLTAVGKLFKPELVFREIKQVIDQALAPDFAQSAYQVKVAPDKKLGIIASITMTEKQDERNNEQATKVKIETLLAAYSFHYQVLFAEQSALATHQDKCI